jgi:Flp pilus assembly protein CpaB
MAISGSGIGRPRRGRLYIVVGTVLAVLAFGTAAAVASLPLLSGSTTGTQVVVAKNDIGARTRIQSSDLELRTVTPKPPQAFTDLAAVAGKGARVDIPAGSPVTANLITQSPDQLTGSGDATFLPIPKGYVAVTVPTSEQVGVAGYVHVGDRITVLATISTAAFGPGPARPVVRTVFHDLIVIRVGPSTTEQAGSAQLTSSLTVLVTACDAEYLFWLLNNAILKYELESFTDYGATPTAPDPACPSVAKAGGVGPVEVNKKWQFTTP